MKMSIDVVTPSESNNGGKIEIVMNCTSSEHIHTVLGNRSLLSIIKINILKGGEIKIFELNYVGQKGGDRIASGNKIMMI